VNQINPIYLGLLLVAFVFLSIFNLNNQKKDLDLAKSEFKSTRKLTDDLVALKNVYANKNKIKKELERILNNPSLTKSELEKSFKKTGVKVTSKSMDINDLNKLMSKMLNGTYNLTSLKIKKLSDTKVDFFMEIKW